MTIDVNYTTGVMGAGKSAQLIEKYREDKRIKVAIAAHLELQTGWHTEIKSRNGQKIENAYAFNAKEDKLYLACKALIECSFAEVVYIDEVQFLPSETVSFIVHYCAMRGINLELFGLEKDFRREYFSSSKYLLAVAKNVKWFNRKCETSECYNIASVNARLIDGKIARDGEQFLEAKASYQSLCNKCYNLK